MQFELDSAPPSPSSAPVAMHTILSSVWSNAHVRGKVSDDILLQPITWAGLLTDFKELC